MPAGRLTGGAFPARCAGIAEGMFAQAMAGDDRSDMDYFADDAHIFMASARRAPGGARAGGAATVARRGGCTFVP